VSNLF